MADTSGLKTIDAVVKEMLLKWQKPLGNYTRYFAHTIDAIRRENLIDMEEGKRLVKLDVNTDINVVNFPSDLVKFINIGVPEGGEVWWLTKKNDIITTTTEVNGAETLSDTYNEDSAVREDFGSSYSAKGGVNSDGYYYPDYRNRRIVLKNISSNLTWVFFSYISSGVDTQSTTYIDQIAVPAIQKYVLWQDAMGAEREVMKREYQEERDILKYHNMPNIVVLDDILNSSIVASARR